MDGLRASVPTGRETAEPVACDPQPPLPGPFDALFEESEAGILILTEQPPGTSWRIRDANAVAAAWLGPAREAVIGRSFESCLESGHSAVAILQQAVNDGSAAETDLVLRRARGAGRAVSASLRPITLEGGAVKRAAIAVLRPRRATDGTDAAEAARARMLARVSHDLRTPLNGILGFAELIEHRLAQGGDRARCRDYASDIAAAGRELLARIEDLLAAGESAEGGAPAACGTVTLPRLLGEVAGRLRPEAARRGVELHLAAPPYPVGLRMHAADGQRMLTLLLEAALRGAPAGSGVHLACERDAEGGLVLLCADRGPALCRRAIAVASWSDMGEGLAVECAPQARSTAGLFTLEQLVQQYGGRLELVPTGESGGLRCRVLLPPELVVADAG